MDVRTRNTDSVMGENEMIDFGNSENVSKLLEQDIKGFLNFHKKCDPSTEEEWVYVFLILRLIQIKECEDEKIWNEFREEIIYKNRFFPQSIILDKIKELSSIASTELKPGDRLFRSREYTAENLFSNEFVEYCLELFKEELPELSINNEDFQTDSLFQTIIGSLAMKPGAVERIIGKYKEAVEEHDGFWGFNAEENDAPPKEKTKSMRVNPEGIRYLYAAEDINTALIEMRPQYGQTYSVAMIEMTESIKLFDFTNDIVKNVNEEGEYVFSRTVLDKMFSDVNYGNSLEYVPTQFISEFIKLQGFDGIIFHSSLSQRGKNIVLFDVDDSNKKYRIVGTEVYGINNINIDYKRILPLEDGDINSLVESITGSNMSVKEKEIAAKQEG